VALRPSTIKDPEAHSGFVVDITIDSSEAYDGKSNEPSSSERCRPTCYHYVELYTSDDTARGMLYRSATTAEFELCIHFESEDTCVREVIVIADDNPNAQLQISLRHLAARNY
jgi:hypothetical protein